MTRSFVPAITSGPRPRAPIIVYGLKPAARAFSSRRPKTYFSDFLLALPATFTDPATEESAIPSATFASRPLQASPLRSVGSTWTHALIAGVRWAGYRGVIKTCFVTAPSGQAPPASALPSAGGSHA